ncbi:glycoside hydrolase family 16 protein [Larkinella insperata]|uniref:Glycoside hydrolase family 16 protein n=1 Tax=Larkinella insperata TaxID=332158 RepID=A0ABW3Q8C7_9BACT
MKNLLLLLALVCFSARSQPRPVHKAFKESFTTPTSPYFSYGSTGQNLPFKSAQGVASPTEPNTTILSFRINPAEAAGAGKGPEIISTKFTHFGTYSARIKVPAVTTIQPNVGAVVGYFTYHADSTAGLSEIDIEWLIADPTLIYIGTWTGQAGALQRIGRTINLAKGIIYTTEQKINYDGTPTLLTGGQNQPKTLPPLPGYDASSQFYTYGFDWHPDRLRWWMLHPTTGAKIVLWDYQGSSLGIPQHASRYRMNFWHTDNWSVETNPLSTEAPKNPYQLEVDWMEYQPLKRP